MSWNDYIVKSGLIIIGYGLLSFLFLIGLFYFVIFATRNQYIISGVRCLKIYITENPKKSIAFIGLIAAMVSCYPVVFFGMSFVSPAGVATLYPYPPFLPGFPLDVITENFRGSDLGATAWSIVPNTVVQYDALTQYFEFPFWSRCVAGGIPLFAQGQSMIGDILHWIPIFSRRKRCRMGYQICFVEGHFRDGNGPADFSIDKSFLGEFIDCNFQLFSRFFRVSVQSSRFFRFDICPVDCASVGSAWRVIGQPRPRLRICVIQAFLLAVVAWLQLNAGAPKEGVITACFMHVLGMIIFIDHVRHRRGWIQSFFIAIGFGLAIVMILSPHWLLFLDALSKSFTRYDNPGVNTFPLWKIIGFFDNFFFQQINGTLAAPSTNVFVLLCLSSAIVRFRRNKSIKLYGTWILFFFAMSVAYGLVPKYILISIPFINKIQHVYNTFSVPMMILALVLAGFGIQYYLDAPVKHKKIILALSLSTFLGLWLVYILMTHSGGTILFFLVFFAVVFTGIWQLYRQAESGVWSNRILIILACCFLLLHVRHGMHLMTGIGEIDAYIRIQQKGQTFQISRQQLNMLKIKSRKK